MNFNRQNIVMKPKREDLFKTPEGYFDDLKSGLKEIPKNQATLRPVFIKQIWVKVASVAAAVALILMIPFQWTSTSSSETYNLGKLSDEDLENYLELYLNDIQLSQLAVETENVDVFETVSDESIYEYVDQNINDYSISELENQ